MCILATMTMAKALIVINLASGLRGKRFMLNPAWMMINPPNAPNIMGSLMQWEAWGKNLMIRTNVYLRVDVGIIKNLDLPMYRKDLSNGPKGTTSGKGKVTCPPCLLGYPSWRIAFHNSRVDPPIRHHRAHWGNCSID